MFARSQWAVTVTQKHACNCKIHCNKLRWRKRKVRITREKVVLSCERLHFVLFSFAALSVDCSLWVAQCMWRQDNRHVSLSNLARWVLPWLACSAFFLLALYQTHRQVLYFRREHFRQPQALNAPLPILISQTIISADQQLFSGMPQHYILLVSN